MKQALIVWGGWPGHEPEQCAAIVADMLRAEGFAVQVETDVEVFGSADLTALSLIVPIVTQATITRASVNALIAAVQGGVGLGGFHGGMGDSFRNEVGYQFMVGGQWVAHPGNIIDYTVNITRPEDPIVAGIADFPYRSEQYYMHVDPNNEVLATTTFTGEHAPWIDRHTIPVVWKRRHGAGRVFYSSLGHQAHELAVPQMRTILQRGLNWAAR
ncbi:MAG: ThuA domain-containing protein [Alphaproteobacteria bacterium]|nr:ThuA domain-containing protein [Alphaproteobacteria bacterium]